MVGASLIPNLYSSHFFVNCILNDSTLKGAYVTLDARGRPLHSLLTIQIFSDAHCCLLGSTIPLQVYAGTRTQVESDFW